jgi:threonine dehydrogenase-like Zn-dependent dehydrogenase
MRRSLVFTSPNQVELISEDSPILETGYVRIAVTRSLVSLGTELQCLRGVFDAGTNWSDWVQYPFRPGYSAVGIVSESKSDRWNVGNRVLVSAPHSSEVYVHENEIYSIPDILTDDEAVWGILSATTQIAVRKANLQMGDRVAIVGLGQLGQLVSQYVYHAHSSCLIYAVDPEPYRVVQAAKHIGVPFTADKATQLMGYEVDVLFEVTGNPNTLQHCAKLVRTEGHIVLLGDTSTPTKQVLGAGVLSKSLNITAVHGSLNIPRWDRARMIDLFFHLIAERKINIASLNTHESEVEEMPAIYKHIAQYKPEIIGQIIRW